MNSSLGMLRQAEIIFLLLMVGVALQLIFRCIPWKRFCLLVLASVALWIGMHCLYFAFLQVGARCGAARCQMALSKWYVNHLRSFRYCDWETSIRWLREAANQKYPEALFVVGDMHANGFRLSYDPEQGLREKALAGNLGFDYSGNSYFLERFLLPREEPIFLGKALTASNWIRERIRQTR